jgi:hypothetical protein
VVVVRCVVALSLFKVCFSQVKPDKDECLHAFLLHAWKLAIFTGESYVSCMNSMEVMKVNKEFFSNIVFSKV